VTERAEEGIVLASFEGLLRPFRGAAGLGLCLLLLGLVTLCCSSNRTEDGAITFWQFWDEPSLYQAARGFENTRPGVEVQIETLTWQSGLEKILASVASGTSPDLCELGSTWVARFAAGGKLAPLSEEDAEWVRNNFFLFEPAEWKGKLYGFPWLVGTRALFYNRELFRRAGLNPDRPPADWKQLLEAARRIDALGEDVYGYGINSGERYVLYKKFMPFAWSNGGRILGDGLDSCVLNSPRNVEALEFYLELSRYSLREKQDVLDRMFLEGKIGMNLSGAWNLRRIDLDAPELDFAVSKFPRPARGDGESVSFAGGEFLVVFESSNHKGEARELARYLVEGKRAFELCKSVRSVLPAMKQFDPGDYFAKRPFDRVFREQLATSMSPPPHPAWAAMEEVLNRYIEEALMGRLGPEAALRKASKKIDLILHSGLR